MTRSWSVARLLRDLETRGRHPAIIAFKADGSETWDSATVADQVLRLARGLEAVDAGRGCRVALWAPNSLVWIVAALAVLAAGGVVLPVDDLANAVQFDAALVSSAAPLVFTTERHLATSRDILARHSVRTILVDGPEGAGRSQTGWRSLLGEPAEDLVPSG
ncbi:MAG: AMP-binding protein, partial [Alphaproteobacteria bacterium]|nr:AMP-binding protein [Alphaproteobacteria bacterium]